MSGLRERKKADTRRALSDAALELAVAQGFDGVTREAIATLAGVSLRTFNNYFSGKYEALAYRITERMRRSIAAFRARPADEPLWTAITEALLGTIAEDLGTPHHPEAFADRTELAEIRTLLLTPEVRNAIPQEHFDDWVRAIAERTGTDPDRDVYPRLVAAVLRAVGDVAMEAYAKADPPVPYPVVLREALAIVGAGLPEPLAHSSPEHRPDHPGRTTS